MCIFYSRVLREKPREICVFLGIQGTQFKKQSKEKTPLFLKPMFSLCIKTCLEEDSQKFLDSLFSGQIALVKRKIEIRVSCFSKPASREGNRLLCQFLVLQGAFCKGQIKSSEFLVLQGTFRSKREKGNKFIENEKHLCICLALGEMQ